MQQTIKLGESSITTVVAALIVVLLATIYYWIKNKNVLPGPKGVPYLGLFPFLGDDTSHIQLKEYTKKYGDVFSFTYSGQLFIHIGSVKVLRELHVAKSDCFTQRMSTFNVLSALLEDGVVVSNGEAWKAHRKFFIQKFREYGLNSLRDTLSGPVNDCIEGTLKALMIKQKESVNIVQLLTEHCTVLLRTILFGEKGITDEEMHEVNVQYAASMESMTGTSMIIMGPFGRFLYGISKAARKSLKANGVVKTVLNTCVTRMEASMNEDSPTCIVEEYFKERNERRKQDDPLWRTFSNKALVSSLAQIAGDGIGTVAAFISGFLNALVEYPEEEEKMYQEIMDAVGSSRQPTLEDKANLPYTTAFMNEVMRTMTSIPLFPSLECTKETSYRGYRIPKGAITLQNFWAIHRNPDTYEDPDAFNPSRYMPAPGKLKAELPVLFGMGKRACSGEAFVMSQTFLFLTTIVKNFKIVSSNDSKNSTGDFLLTGKLELQFEPRPDTEI